ncbi:calcium-binding protein [Actinoplanes philippinensis]|uniref:calcium-binding protein n=1 Tax=Actinoplanes philippinensis TaxID=35752 RepID=UPI0033DE5017
MTLATGVVAVPAQAASTGVVVVRGKRTVEYQAGSGRQNNVVVTRSGRTITIDDRVAVKPGKGCRPVKNDKTKVTCTTAKTPTEIRIFTHDRNDVVVNRTDVRLVANGGTGRDRLTGGPRGDNLAGGSGDDILVGGAGDDTLLGDSGNDRVYGGAGDDGLFGERGRDRLEGGAGFDFLEGDDPALGVAADVLLGGPDEDSVSYGSYRKPLTIDLDGSARDDGQAGEHDTVGADIETVFGGWGSDRITGNAADNFLRGSGGNDILLGGAGNDYLDGDSDRDRLYGGSGDDELIGDEDSRAVDRLDGGTNSPAGDACRPDSRDTKVGCERRAPR